MGKGRDLPRVLGLAEFMNVPGAVLGLPGALDKLLAFADGPIDGHAPGITGRWLQAYVAAGPATDHESTTAAEALEKARLGMAILIREATAAKNVLDLLPAVTAESARRFAFATDDRHPADLIEQGSIDHNVRLAISGGLDPIRAIQMATLNAAEVFGLHDRGAIAPGRRADLVVIPTLTDFHALQVFAGGRLVAQDGAPVGEWSTPSADDTLVRESIHIELEHLRLGIAAEGRRLRAIGIVPDQIITTEEIVEARIEDGNAVSDVSRDLVKLAVVERHQGSGKVGLGFVKGLGLKRGAIAGSVGHDCHNVTVAGVADSEMLAAVEAVKHLGGGLVAVLEGEVIAAVPLPIGGLMSDQPVAVVRSQMDSLLLATQRLGSPLHDPFMHLGFLALEVIPSLKLTDQGLVDVERFGFVPLWVD